MSTPFYTPSRTRCLQPAHGKQGRRCVTCPVASQEVLGKTVQLRKYTGAGGAATARWPLQNHRHLLRDSVLRQALDSCLQCHKLPVCSSSQITISTAALAELD